MRQKYLIKAGITKLGKQQYINYYEDVDDWDISVVPLPLGKSLANKILKRVQKEYVERMNNGSSFKHKYPNVEFEIVEYVQTFPTKLEI